MFRIVAHRSAKSIFGPKESYLKDSKGTMIQIVPMRDEVLEKWHLVHLDNDQLYIDGRPVAQSSPLRNAIINLLLVWEDHYEGVPEKWDVT